MASFEKNQKKEKKKKLGIDNDAVAFSIMAMTSHHHSLFVNKSMNLKKLSRQFLESIFDEGCPSDGPQPKKTLTQCTQPVAK